VSRGSELGSQKDRNKKEKSTKRIIKIRKKENLKENKM
jgi:hypothetical protein